MVFSSVTGKRALMWRLRPLVFVAAGGWKAIPEGPALKAGKVDTRVAATAHHRRLRRVDVGPENLRLGNGARRARLPVFNPTWTVRPGIVANDGRQGLGALKPPWRLYP